MQSKTFETFLPNFKNFIMNKLIFTSVALMIAVFVYSNGFSQSISGNESSKQSSSMKPVPSVVKESVNPNDAIVTWDAKSLIAVPAKDPKLIKQGVEGGEKILKAEPALDLKGSEENASNEMASPAK